MARLTECPCGSGEHPDAVTDGYGIFLFYACEKCYAKKVSGFRSDIFERYACEEPIEEEY